MAAIADKEKVGEGDTRQLLTERIKRSAERSSGHYRTLRKFWRYYLTNSDRSNKRRENDRDEGAGADWRANLFVPASFSVIETAVPRAVFALFGARPFVKARGREKTDAENAEAVTAMLDYDFEQSRVLMMAVEFFKSLYIFGTAVCRVDHVQDFYDITRPPQERGYDVDVDFDDEGEILDARPTKRPDKMRVMRYDGPKARLVSLFDFFPDPLFDNIPDMRYVAEREETTKKKLEDENKKFYELNDEYKYKNLDDIKPYKEGQMADIGLEEDFRQDTDEIMRFGSGYGGRDRSTSLGRDDDSVRLYHYWEDNRYVVMANGHTIIRDDENPYNDQRKPYIAAPCFPTLKEFYGQGLLAPIQYLQEELNTLRNIALDQGKLNLYGIWAIDPSLTMDDTDLAIHPGKVINMEFQGGRPPVAQVFQNTLPSDWERLESRVQSDIQSTLAINDYMIGAGGGSAGTASEAAMLNASAANRFRLQALIAQERFVAELADMFLSRRQQFMHEKKVFRVLGEQGYDYPELSPEEIWGRFDFEPQGSQSQPNKEVLRQQWMQQIPVLAGNQFTAPLVNWPEMVKEGFKLFDQQFPERFYAPPPEKQISQKQENYIILRGEKVAVDPNEDHQQHMQDLMNIMPDVLQAAQAGEQRVMEAFQDHQQQHQKYLQAMQGSAQGGQAPGQMGGAPGNQPNMENQNIPSMPSMMASVMGGPGGPVA